MFNWLARLPINHFGVLDPRYVRGYYTGIGRALYKIECLNKDIKKVEEQKKNFYKFL